MMMIMTLWYGKAIPVVVVCIRVDEIKLDFAIF